MAGRQCLSTEPEVEERAVRRVAERWGAELAVGLAEQRVAGRMAVELAEPEPEAVHMLVDDMQAVEEQRLR